MESPDLQYSWKFFGSNRGRCQFFTDTVQPVLIKYTGMDAKEGETKITMKVPSTPHNRYLPRSAHYQYSRDKMWIRIPCLLTSRELYQSWSPFCHSLNSAQLRTTLQTCPGLPSDFGDLALYLTLQLLLSEAPGIFSILLLLATWVESLGLRVSLCSGWF